jgi:hypothetical protein
MLTERDLVRLIMQLNPYVTPPNHVTPQNPLERNMIFVNPIVNPAAEDHRVAALDAAIPPDFRVFDFETQDNPAYAMDWRWLFKGHDRIIRRALRFEYRYPVLNGSGALATEHLLIGYEGGAGP